jgi:Cof subfamily protein (haloacid dehalogenase superfamily)
MIRLAAIDLDGTLYNSRQEITVTNKQALQKAVLNGVQVAIITGRGRRGAENALAVLDMDFPYICSAGALVCSGINGKTLHAWTYYRHDEMSCVIQFARQTGAGLLSEIPEAAPRWFGSDTFGEMMDPLTAKEISKSVRTFEPEEELDRPLLKTTVIAAPEILRQFEGIIRAKCPSLHQTYAGPNYLDLTAKDVNKGTALRALAEHLGLQSAEVAAIGDQSIDLSMLHYAGLPVAMSNAVPSLKEAAQWIAPSNDEDGVAWVLDEILKRNM